MQPEARQTLLKQIENGCIDGYRKLFGQVVQDKQITQAELCNRFLEHEEDENCIPTIDVRKVRHIKLHHPFDAETIAQLQKVGYNDNTIAMLGTHCQKEEDYRQRVIKHNMARGLSREAVEKAFGAEFIPLTHIPEDECHPARQTKCGEKHPVVYSLATHLPPLRLHTVQMQSYIEACVKNLCEGVKVNHQTLVYYDFYLDDEVAKLYLFASFK